MTDAGEDGTAGWTAATSSDAAVETLDRPARRPAPPRPSEAAVETLDRPARRPAPPGPSEAAPRRRWLFPDGRTRARLPDGRARARLFWAVCAVVLLVATAWLPWEWSFIDDGTLLTITERHVSQHGPLGALLPAAEELYRADRAWGLFRPAFWVSVAAFYQLPVGAAHAVRLGLLAVVFLAAIVTVTRGTTGRRRTVLGVWTGLVVVSIGTLFATIWYPSLQELSGLFFVSLGLLAWRRPWLVAGCWLVAAWFKTPFAWLLLAFGLLQLVRRGRRAVGVAAVGAAAGTIAAAVRFARGGWYTTSFVSTEFGVMRDHAVDAVAALLRPGAVIGLGALVLVPRLRPRFDPHAAQWPLLAGGLGYLANLLQAPPHCRP